jgi:MFS transporter, ACDE family, multidrug resistance protein
MSSQVIRERNLHIIFAVTLMAVLGVASISPAFPSIMKYFDIDEERVGLLITYFTFPGIILSPLMGILADRLGRKNILIPSLFLFALAGGSCVFIRDFNLLLGFRFLQGIGAASLSSINSTIIGDLYTGKKRVEAMGYNASVLSVGTAAYPAIGGLLAFWGWYFPFLLPLLALPVGIIALYSLKNPEPREKINLKNYLANTWKNINKSDVWALFTISFLGFVVLYGAHITYFPMLMVKRFSSNTMIIGICMSVFSVVTAITASQMKRINSWLKVRTQLLFSFLLYAITMAFMAYAHSWIFLIFPLITFGLGQGMLIPAKQSLLVGYAPMKERAGFMSVNSMVLRLGQTAGPLVTGLLFIYKGITFVFLGGALISLLMFFIILFVKSSRF